MNNSLQHYSRWVRGPGLRVLIVSLLLVFSDTLVIYWLGLENKFPRPVGLHFSQTFFFCLLLGLSVSCNAFFIWARVLLTFSFCQWLSLAYYGSYLSPMMIYLFFREFSEVLESSKGATSLIVKPFVVWSVVLSLFSFLPRLTPEWPSLLKMRTKNIIKALIIFVILYPIPRTYVTGHTFGKQAKVQELSLMNFYGALSYFFGRILPVKAKAWVSVSGGNSGDLSALAGPPPLQEKNPQRHVVFILGESLGLRHLQLFGYPLETTPQLLALHQKGKLLQRKGVSGGVSTDVSIPMLIHGTHGEEAAATVAAQSRCIFKLAKNNGFQTAFISVQTQENLQHISNYFCTTFLDYFKVGDNSQTINGESAILDEELLKEAQALSWKQPQFVVFHQRGSHSPYDMRYPPTQAFHKIEATDSWADQQIKHYDNSVRYTDQNIVNLIQWIRTHSMLPVEVVFTSDHGEALGEDQQWGHVILHPVAAEVPVMYFPLSPHSSFASVFSNAADWVSHRFVSSFLMHLLGYTMESSPPEKEQKEKNLSEKSVFSVMGTDLDGLGGSMKVRPKEAAQGQELERLPE